MSAVGSSSVAAVKMMVGVLTLVKKKKTSLPGKEKSVAIHAETHGHDGAPLSEEPSTDVHRLPCPGSRFCVSL